MPVDALRRAARPAVLSIQRSATFDDEVVTVALLVALATVFYLSPWPVVYLSAFLLLAGLSWLRLELALLLVVLFAPLFMLPKHVGSEEFAPSEIFLLLDVALVATHALIPARRDRLGRRRLAGSPFFRPGILLLLAAALSTLVAADRHVALRAWREVVAEPLLFFGLVVLVASAPRHRRWLAAALLATGVYVGVIALAQFAGHQNLTAPAGASIERVKAVYGSPDNLGLLYDRVIPLWFALVALAVWWPRASPHLQADPRPAARENENRQPQTGALRGAGPVLPHSTAIGLAWLALGAMFGAVFFLTFSRGAWVAVGAGCLFVLTLLFRWGRWLAAACILVGLAGLAVEGPSVTHRLNVGHVDTVQRRVDVWRSSIHMIRDHPLFGVGPDNFLHYYAPKTQSYIPCSHGLGYMEPEAWQEPCLSHPHDEIGDFWLSTGLLGLGAFLWLQLVFWRTGLRAWRRWRGHPEGALVLGVMAAMFASLAHGLVDNSYFLPDLSLLFWLLCALIDLTSRAPLPSEPSLSPAEPYVSRASVAAATHGSRVEANAIDASETKGG